MLPDTKTIAVVEWLEPGDARKAFKGLAYKRYRHVPVYVEWAPEGIFVGDQPVGSVNGVAARTPKIDGGGLGLEKMKERDAIMNAKAPGGTTTTTTTTPRGMRRRRSCSSRVYHSPRRMRVCGRTFFERRRRRRAA